MSFSCYPESTLPVVLSFFIPLVYINHALRVPFHDNFIHESLHAWPSAISLKTGHWATELYPDCNSSACKFPLVIMKMDESSSLLFVQSKAKQEKRMEVCFAITANTDQ